MKNESSRKWSGIIHFHLQDQVIYMVKLTLHIKFSFSFKNNKTPPCLLVSSSNLAFLKPYSPHQIYKNSCFFICLVVLKTNTEKLFRKQVFLKVF